MQNSLTLSSEQPFVDSKYCPLYTIYAPILQHSTCIQLASSSILCVTEHPALLIVLLLSLEGFPIPNTQLACIPAPWPGHYVYTVATGWPAWPGPSDVSLLG